MSRLSILITEDDKVDLMAYKRAIGKTHFVDTEIDSAGRSYGL